MLHQLGPMANILKRMPPTGQLKLFGLLKIPLLLLINPKVLRLDDEVCEMLVPLNYMTRNHIGSMYFGTMAIAADGVALMHGLHIASSHSVAAVPIFKSFSGQFMKRAETDVVFRCAAGGAIKEIMEKAVASGERINQDIEISAFAADNMHEPLAKFTLGVSVRAKRS